mmetsp:Transcript_45047/g.138994  ORF Transcript_45047/g.138994 Transcript_45047/m.138994 type:complete len:95 (+) Transcript_45047:1729-2013(+)
MRRSLALDRGLRMVWTETLPSAISSIVEAGDIEGDCDSSETEIEVLSSIERVPDIPRVAERERVAEIPDVLEPREVEAERLRLEECDLKSKAIQ